MFVGDLSDFLGGVSKEFCVRRLSNWFPIEMPAGSVANTRRPWWLKGGLQLKWLHGVFRGSIHLLCPFLIPNAKPKIQAQLSNPVRHNYCNPTLHPNSTNPPPISITFPYFSSTFTDGRSTTHLQNWIPRLRQMRFGTIWKHEVLSSAMRKVPTAMASLWPLGGARCWAGEGRRRREMTRRCYSNLSIWHGVYDLARLQLGVWMCLVNQFGGNWTWREGTLLIKGKDGPAFQGSIIAS